MMSEPAPTEVSPTMKPPTTPMAMMAGRLILSGPASTWRVGKKARATMAAAPRISAAPRIICRCFSAALVEPSRCMQ